MRPSSRMTVIQSALQIAAEAGGQGITFESVAARAGITKGGILYHFSTKDALIEGIVEHVVAEWDARAQRHLARPFADASREDRVAAFVLATLDEIVDRAELTMFVDSLLSEALSGRWMQMRERWVGDLGELTHTQHLALLAADGMWIDHAGGQLPFPPAHRDRVVRTLRELVYADEAITISP